MIEVPLAGGTALYGYIASNSTVTLTIDEWGIFGRDGTTYMVGGGWPSREKGVRHVFDHLGTVRLTVGGTVIRLTLPRQFRAKRTHWRRKR